MELDATRRSTTTLRKSWGKEEALVDHHKDNLKKIRGLSWYQVTQNREIGK